MNWNTAQVARVLGVTTSAVRDLAKRGHLHDVATNAPGQSKHIGQYRAVEVRAFKKTYRNRRRNMATAVETAPLARLERIEREIRAMRSAVDSLVKVWQ